MMTIRQRLVDKVSQALGTLYSAGYLSGQVPEILLSPPKQAAHGDYSCTVALALAKAAGKKPRDIAEQLCAAIGDGGGLLAKTEIAGPGFVNLFVADSAWREVLVDILTQGDAFLHSNRGEGRKVLVEFVSANPTGPLHVAHGRGAVTGDVLAHLLRVAGYAVEREYYVNDMGHQIDVMARSIYLRYAELHGRPLTAPEDFYPGEYIIDIAKDLTAEVGAAWLDLPETQWLGALRERGVDIMLRRIRADLDAFGVRFDHWVSEKELTERVGLHDMLKRLQDAGHVYEQDGKKWFRSTHFGDDKDRVVLREDGRPTYFASDIAYHDNKLQRGFTQLINIWGADHGGYVARVKAGLAALGYAGDPLTVVLMQMVSLSRGGEAVRMGKRLGTAVWLREIIDEAGRDATRYFFIMRRSDSQMDFDIDLATRRSIENPVYYAQMGHARLASIGRKAVEAGIPRPNKNAAGVYAALTLPEELELLKTMARAPDVLADAAEALEPHLVVHYLQGLIAQFHSYYTQYKNSERVISDDPDKTAARLLLCEGLQAVLKMILGILGVGAPERMTLADSTSDESDATS